MLQTQALNFRYPSGPAFAFPDLQAQAGAPLLILGQSGRGKTTLLHLLAGLLRPATGTVRIGDTELTSLSTKALDRFRGRQIGLVFQKAHLVAALTLRDNLRLTQYLAGLPTDDARIDSLLRRLGIGDKATALPARLSLGEQQRASIARALLNQPQLLLADEPTSALDDYHAAEVIDLLQEEAARARAALVIVTHDQRLKDRIDQRVEL
ncbi:MAG: ATP-binding cassette domain-containing protein [Bacteroidetes bacterium]|nr:MAG: ATP-binding cassette domain-containing protein [Bacteroidota bacterium]